jgi:phosphate transport system substrate-binding protein
LIAGILGFVLQHRIAGLRPAGGDVAVCTVPLAKQLAGDLVKAYAQKSGTAPDHYDLIDGAGCDIILSTAAETPDAIIANDGIVAIVNPLNPVTRLSETQLREIFEGTIRDWSQLGGSPGPIVPILPEGSSAEAKALAATLFFNVALDTNIRRAESSSAVTRFVTGAGRDSRGAIGLVTFSQTIPAKVVQLAYLPPPSVVSIASHRYPYTISISINAASNRADPAISGLVAFAKSDAGAAIVEASGFIPRKGL